MNALCASIFPALQRTLVLNTLRTGVVNRVREVSVSIGGKAVNSARVLKTLGAEPLLFGFSGGDTGHAMERLLDAENLPHRFVRTDAPVRLCQTLLADDAGDFTELVEEGPRLPPEDWQRMQAQFASLLKETQPHSLILSGTLPGHAPPDTYAQMLAASANTSTQVLIDASGPPLSATLAYHPTLVKINVGELFQTTGSDVPDTAEATAIEAAAHALIAQGAAAVGITQGGSDAWLVTPTRTYRFSIPRVNVISTLGCGDAVNAGCVYALRRGDPIQDAFAFGLACGASNATHRLSGRIDPAGTATLFARIKATVTGRS